jgi:neutral ceramidase
MNSGKWIRLATAAMLVAAGAGMAGAAGKGPAKAAPAAMRAVLDGPLRAGAAKADITPPDALYPLQSGQLFSSTHDPIFARALALDNGRDRIVLVTADVTELPNGNDLLQGMSAALGVPADHLILSATHNHNAPTGGNSVGTSSPYYAVLKSGMIAAAKEAVGKLEPARVGYATDQAYVNINRDEQIGAGYHMGFNPEGPTDRTVAVMSLTRPDGSPIAVYANYAVHGVVMYRAHTKGDEIQVTGDLPGWTSRYVEDRLKGAVALWTSGAAGDQNPLYMATYNQDAPDVVDEGAGGWAILDVQARRLGEAIVRASRATANTTDRARLWGAQTAVTCPGQVRAEPPTPGVPMQGYAAPARIAMKDGPAVTIPLHLVMINDIALAGASAEVYSEIGLHVKRASAFDRTMMVTLLPNRVGYIPTDKAYLLPSEKAITNSLKPGCAEPAMVDGYARMEAQYLKEGR